MKHRSTDALRWAPKASALALACLFSAHAAALGLGRLTVTSALGETLRAEIEVTNLSTEEASSLRLRVAPPEAYRAAGVEYNAVLASAQVQVVRRSDGRQVLRVTSDRAVLEPFVDVIIEASWSSGRLVREYTLLFDPPGGRLAQAPAAPPPMVNPAVSPAPAAPVSPAEAPTVPAVPAAPRAAAKQPPLEPPRPPVASAAPPAPEGGNEIRVRPGDSLSRIAARAQRTGISLDQMLVSLFRGNPQAFVGDNMNRLKSGAVLSLPSSEQAAKLSLQEARETIVAQSADFAAYRQRLAAGTTTAADATPARQAKGQVQAQVDDRKQGSGAPPDRLTLSQGSAKASAPEVLASRDAQKKDEKSRLAELARNVDELKKLQGATATAPGAKPAASPAPPAPAPALPTVVAAAPPAPVAPPPPPPPPAPNRAPAPTVAPTASPAPAAPAASAVSKATPAAPVRAEEPGLFDSLLDNSMLLPGAGVLALLVAGWGVYRLRSRMRKPAGETSFLESRLQPDSFFGASGGQRIDTRDASASASGNSSSMSYSLSQLDAIGDVDPVAEADVYLAYGRDLQAEEILKEAMRATPERMAIRSKLLEVYAKRRDTKAFELLATQLFNLTRGEGEDWAKAQVLGQGLEPDNPLYQPGGLPEDVRSSGEVVDQLNAVTQPYTAPAMLPAFQPAADATLDGTVDGGLDLDLELEAPAGRAPVHAAPSMPETTLPFTTSAEVGQDATLDLTLEAGESKTIPVRRNVAPPATPAADDMLDFDLGSLSTEPTTVALPRKPAPSAEPAGIDFGDFSIGGQPLAAGSEANDPLARKIELAEEFRQIGDMEGARDLLEEVVAKAEGAVKSKAQGMLDKLA